MNLQEMRKDITRLIDDIKYHSDSLTPHHQLPIIQLNIILAKMNKMIEKTIILKHHLEMRSEGMKFSEDVDIEEEVQEIRDLSIEKESQETAETTQGEVVSTDVSSSDISQATDTSQKDIAEKLKNSPIPDLKSAIGIYERYLYANELFKGSIEAYDEAISALNEFESLEKAQYYIHEGLVKEFDWDVENEFVNTFCELVERRYDKN